MGGVVANPRSTNQRAFKGVANIGAGAQVAKANVDGISQLRSLVAQLTGISIDEQTNELSLALDIANLVANATPGSGAVLAVQNGVGVLPEKISIGELGALLGDTQNVGAGVAVFKGLNGLTAEFKTITIAADGGVAVTGNANDVAFSLAIQDLVAKAAIDMGADQMVIYDAAGSVHRKILLDELFDIEAILKVQVFSA